MRPRYRRSRSVDRARTRVPDGRPSAWSAARSRECPGLPPAEPTMRCPRSVAGWGTMIWFEAVAWEGKKSVRGGGRDGAVPADPLDPDHRCRRDRHGDLRHRCRRVRRPGSLAVPAGRAREPGAGRPFLAYGRLPLGRLPCLAPPAPAPLLRPYPLTDSAQIRGEVADPPLHFLQRLRRCDAERSVRQASLRDCPDILRHDEARTTQSCFLPDGDVMSQTAIRRRDRRNDDHADRPGVVLGGGEDQNRSSTTMFVSDDRTEDGDAVNATPDHVLYSGSSPSAPPSASAARASQAWPSAR